MDNLVAKFASCPDPHGTRLLTVRTLLQTLKSESSRSLSVGTLLKMLNSKSFHSQHCPKALRTHTI
jgi:hypothetical protein